MFKYRLLGISIFIFVSINKMYSQPCSQFPQATDYCVDAPLICDLREYCHSLPYSALSLPVEICGTPIMIDNPRWISFIATDPMVSITITPANCRPGGMGGTLVGLEAAIVANCPNPLGGPYETVGTCQATCTTAPFTIGGGIFAPGRKYWLVIDGCDKSTCDYMITAYSGIDAPFLISPEFITGSTEKCIGSSAAFTAHDHNFLANEYIWTINGAPISSPWPTLFYDVPSDMEPGIYQICVENAENECYNLIDDNDYVPNSVCAEFEVIGIPDTEHGPFNICVENAPFSFGGYFFNPGDTAFSYTLVTPLGCDSTINLTMNWVEHYPQDQEYYVCEGEFPYDHPLIGPIWAAGSEYYNIVDQEYLCDSSFFITLHEVVFDFDVKIPRTDLQCPGQIIRVDASQSRAILQPSGDDLFNVNYKWYRNGTLIGNGVFLNITQAGTYVFKMEVAEHGLQCSKEFEFKIFEFFTPPEAPIIEGNLGVCVNTTAEYVISNWNGQSEITFLPGTCYDIVDTIDNKVYIQFTEACTDSVCVVLNKPNCPVLNSRSCFVISTFDQLTPEISGDFTFCPEQSTFIEADSGYVSYEWTGPGNFSSDESEIEVDVSGNYTVLVTDSNGCTGTETVLIEEGLNPSITFSGSFAFCPGGQTTITVVPGNYTDYLWDDGTSGPQNTFDIAGTYTVSVTDQMGCNNSANVTVLLQDSLSPNITGDLGFCEGTSTVLDGGAGFTTYIWNGVPGTQTYTVNMPGLVTLFVADASGCVGSTREMIVQNQNPTPTIDVPKTGICPNENLLLNVNPANFVQYEWSDGMLGQNRTINVAEQYIVTVTDLNGCIGNTSISITQHLPPNPIVIGDSYFCTGEDASIGIQNTFSEYLWSDNQTSQIRAVNVAGTYLVTVTDSNGCTGETSYTVDERANPQPQITGDAAFCQGFSTTLGLTQNYTSYVWSGAGSGSNNNLPISQGGIYIVEVTDAFGCRGSSSLDVVLHPNPDVTILGSTTYCVGLSTTLDAGSYQQYNWTGPGVISPTNRTQRIDVPGTYSVIVTDVNGCVGSSSVMITEDTELTISIGGPEEYCEGTTSTIGVEGLFANYSWAPGGQTTQTINVTAGIYTVTATDSEGCTGSQTITVIENPNPQPNIIGPTTFCLGQDAILDAGQWIEYQWSDGLGFDRVVTIDQTGNYTVTVTDINGCEGTTTFFVQELDELQPEIDGDLFFCTGLSTQIVTETGFVRYTWLDNNNTNPIRIIDIPGTYVIEVEDSQGCTGTGEVTIIENPLPVADAGEEQELTCRDREFTIGGNGTSVGNFSYSWREIESGTQLTDRTRFILINQKGLYELTVRDDITGCENTDLVRIHQNENVIRDLEFNSINPLCHNEESGSIIINNIEGGIEPYIYSINGINMPNGEASNLGSGVYTIIVEDQNGCTLTSTITLTNPPQIYINAGPDRRIEEGESIEIIPTTNVTSNNISNIRWEEGSFVICNDCPELLLNIIPENPNTFKITITDIFGCIASDLMIVDFEPSRKVFLPTAFSPDRNGINDHFTVFAGEDVSIIKSLKIYNRWGSLIYEGIDLPINDSSYGWDGTFMGQELDPAVFIYVCDIEFIDGELIQVLGEVSLMK